MKKVIKVIGIIDSIALVIAGLMYFLFDFSLTPMLPVLLIILIFCCSCSTENAARSVRKKD